MTIIKRIKEHFESFRKQLKKDLNSVSRKEFKMGEKIRFGLINSMMRTRNCVIENAILYNEKGVKEGYLDLLEEEFEKIARSLDNGENIIIYQGSDHINDNKNINRLSYIVEKDKILIVNRDPDTKTRMFPNLSQKTEIEIRSITLQEAEDMI